MKTQARPSQQPELLCTFAVFGNFVLTWPMIIGWRPVGVWSLPLYLFVAWLVGIGILIALRPPDIEDIPGTGGLPVTEEDGACTPRSR